MVIKIFCLYLIYFIYYTHEVKWNEKTPNFEQFKIDIKIYLVPLFIDVFLIGEILKERFRHMKLSRGVSYSLIQILKYI